MRDQTADRLSHVRLHLAWRQVKLSLRDYIANHMGYQPANASGKDTLYHFGRACEIWLPLLRFSVLSPVCCRCTLHRHHQSFCEMIPMVDAAGITTTRSGRSCLSSTVFPRTFRLTRMLRCPSDWGCGFD